MSQKYWITPTIVQAFLLTIMSLASDITAAVDGIDANEKAIVLTCVSLIIAMENTKFLLLQREIQYLTKDHNITNNPNVGNEEDIKSLTTHGLKTDGLT